MMRFILKNTLILSLTLLMSPAVSHAELIEKIYAVVNGEIITLSEIAEYQEKLKSGGFLNDILFADPEEREKALNDRQHLIQLMIYEKIMDYEIKQQSLQVTEERVRKEITTIAKRQNLSFDQLEQILERQGVDFLEYQKFVKNSIERRQLIEKEVTSKIKISEQDIMSEYLASSDGDGKAQVFEYNLSHLLLSDSEAAEKVAGEIKAGSNFEQLVKEYSEDEDTKNNKGTFGRFKTGEMIGPIEAAIRDLEIGQTSGIVKTPMGYHIFKVLDKKLVNDPQLEQQRSMIYQKLFTKALKEQLDFWLSQKQKDAIVQVN